jgi:probable F420-dependent oxidoreductase
MLAFERVLRHRRGADFAKMVPDRTHQERRQAIMFKVYATTPETMGPGEIGAHAARAEAMGFDGLHVPDAVHDGLLLSALALNATRRLVVGTAVLVAFPRSPMNVAIASWDLQKMSGGRFELGLGTQIKPNIEQRYSARWGSPVAHLREYLQSLRAIFHSFQTGAPLRFEGEYFRFTRLQPFFNPGPIEHPDIPLLCGAVGPLMTAMVAEHADGMITHPTNTPPEYIEQVCLPRLATGFAAAQRDASRFRLVLGPLTATGKDDAVVAREWEKQRQMLGFLYSTPAYWPSLELFGWQGKGALLQQMTREGAWSRMPEIITDEMMHKFVPRGTYGEIADVFRERYARLCDCITFPLPEDPRDDGLAAQAIVRLKA